MMQKEEKFMLRMILVIINGFLAMRAQAKSKKESVT